MQENQHKNFIAFSWAFVFYFLRPHTNTHKRDINCTSFLLTFNHQKWKFAALKFVNEGFFLYFVIMMIFKFSISLFYEYYHHISEVFTDIISFSFFMSTESFKVKTIIDSIVKFEKATKRARRRLSFWKLFSLQYVLMCTESEKDMNINFNCFLGCVCVDVDNKNNLCKWR